jgi:hypothetical protein
MLAAVGRRDGMTEAVIARAVDRAPAGGALTVGQARELLSRRTTATPSEVSLAAVRAISTRPAALACAYPRTYLPAQRMGRDGLTPRAAALRRAMESVFGPQRLGGFAPGGVTSGHVDNSSHYDGRAIDVFFRPITAQNKERGWLLAQWLVAHAAEHHVLSVIYDDRIWTVWASGFGWRPYVHPSGNTTNPILRHLEHVHVAVVRGPPRTRTP